MKNIRDIPLSSTQWQAYLARMLPRLHTQNIWLGKIAPKAGNLIRKGRVPTCLLPDLYIHSIRGQGFFYTGGRAYLCEAPWPMVAALRGSDGYKALAAAAAHLGHQVTLTQDTPGTLWEKLRYGRERKLVRVHFTRRH